MLISYFHCVELPTDPAMWFTVLFLIRERWKAEDIKLYLSDIAVDTKGLDKLLLKHARALTDTTAHGIRHEPDDSDNEHCSSLVLTQFFVSTVQHLVITIYLCIVSSERDFV